MKILFTGSTSKQISHEGDRKAQIKRINDSTILINSLKQLNHVIERRELRWGDDISYYDLAIVGIGSFNSPNYHSILNAMYAIRYSKKVILFHEDWKIHDTIKTYKNLLLKRNLDYQRNKKWKGGNTFYKNANDPKINNEEIYDTVEDILNGKYNYIVPGFKWGDKSIIAKILQCDISKVHSIDLTPHVLEIEDIKQRNITTKPSEKYKKYMIATLANHDNLIKKLPIEWQIDFYGSRRIGLTPLPSEKAVYDVMNNYVGILCPEYPHSGSGWFRMRYIYSAFNNNILLLPKKDAEALNLPWYPNLELFNDNELDNLAEMQKKAILDNLTTLDDFNENLNNIIMKVINNE